MRNEPNVKIERYRVNTGDGLANCNTGAFFIPIRTHRSGCLKVICSNGGGWDHVSVSLPDRCPTWDEMCVVTDLFFKDDETVMQLRPPKSCYVNNHPFCLHLWRPQTTEEISEIRQTWGGEWPMDYPAESVGEIPLPPEVFVGLKTLNPLTLIEAIEGTVEL